METIEKEIPRAYTHEDIERRTFDVLAFTDEWLRHLGDNVERSGSILIYGGSGHGKTTYALQLMKQLCNFGKVLYDSVEEGMKASFKRSLDINNIKSVSAKYVFQSEPLDELTARLSRKRQPKIVVIDSVQYCFRGKNSKDYFDFVGKFPDTLFVWVSQMQKGSPKGAVADDIKYDAQLVIHVKDFKAYVEKSRTGADESVPYVISQEKAAEREVNLTRKL
ncbi:MAG: AAA family ATPase [Capnocytophaga sp.]|nr:AAA family ATPase [Capnocytophaga sp.]